MYSVVYFTNKGFVLLLLFLLVKLMQGQEICQRFHFLIPLVLVDHVHIYFWEITFNGKLFCLEGPFVISHVLKSQVT